MNKSIQANESLVKREGGILIPFSILTDTNLTNTEKHLYSYVLAFNVNGLDYFAGSDATGIKLGLNPVQVRRAIARLCNLGYLTRAKSNGLSVLRCNKLIQLTDPIVTNRYTSCNKSLQETTQIVTHNNIYNNLSNNDHDQPHENENKETQNNIPYQNQKTEQEVLNLPETQKSSRPSPKKVTRKKGSPVLKMSVDERKAAGLIPCPYDDDESLLVWMKPEKWQRFCAVYGIERAFYLCDKFEKWAKNSTKADDRIDHYATLETFNENEERSGRVWAFVRDRWGYYEINVVDKYGASK